MLRIEPQRPVSKIATTAGMDLHVWLREALDHSKINQADLARELTKELGRSITKSAVGNMLRDRTHPWQRRISADELLAIEKITNYPAPTSLADFPRDERRRWDLRLRSMPAAKRQALFSLLDTPDTTDD